MQRVMIVGQPGSGKSTLARRLGAALDLPVHHMDRIHWLPGWVQRDTNERERLTLEVIKAEAWVFEGGFSKTHPQRLERCDTLIWLDLPIGRRLWNVTKRLYQHYGKVRTDMQDGCPESIGAHSFEFYQFIWKTRHQNRERLQLLVDAAGPEKHIAHLRSFAEVEKFLASL